ncbi:MAG: DegV family protein [Christensenellales bacterium]
MPRIRIAACLDTLELSGARRAHPKAAADLGKLVNLKPLVVLSPEGRVAMAGKAIGRHRAGDALIKLIKASPADPRYPILPLYTGGRENCIAFLRQAAQAGYACTIDDAISVGPTIGAHVGPGVFGLAYVSAQA